MLAAVAELIFRCKTTDGVCEKRVNPNDAEHVNVSRLFGRRSLTHDLQLAGMGLMEVPCELFRLTSVKRLWLHDNMLCSLPSEIAHLATLETLNV